jgi:hypothetical protein
MQAAISPEAPRVAGVLPRTAISLDPIWRCHARSLIAQRLIGEGLDRHKPERPRCQGCCAVSPRYLAGAELPYHSPKSDKGRSDGACPITATAANLPP